MNAKDTTVELLEYLAVLDKDKEGQRRVIFGCEFLIGGEAAIFSENPQQRNVDIKHNRLEIYVWSQSV